MNSGSDNDQQAPIPMMPLQREKASMGNSNIFTMNDEDINMIKENIYFNVIDINTL